MSRPQIKVKGHTRFCNHYRNKLKIAPLCVCCIEKELNKFKYVIHKRLRMKAMREWAAKRNVGA